MNTTALEGLDAPAVEETGYRPSRWWIDELGPMERISETFRKAALLSGLHGHAPHDDCRDRRGRPAGRADGAWRRLAPG